MLMFGGDEILMIASWERDREDLCGVWLLLNFFGGAF